MNTSPLLRYFADELRIAREAAGLTQDALANAINFSKSHVGMVETCGRAPKDDFATAVDRVLRTDGRFSRMLDKLLRAEARPEWFRQWEAVEREATALRVYAPLLVPGLLQTEDYARAVLRFVDEPEERLNRRVAARLERQAVISRDPPPELVFVMDERVIRSPVGGVTVMRQQLISLAKAAERTLVQVVPVTAETYHGLAGPFEIATVDGLDMVYTDTQLRGYVSGHPETVNAAKRRWDAVRAEALPRRASIQKIMEAADSWSG